MSDGLLTDREALLVEAVARRAAELVVEKLEQWQRQPQAGLVDAAELAELLRVNRGWVYRHAQQLGAVRLPGGPGEEGQGRLRFDPERAREAIGCQTGKQSPTHDASADGQSDGSRSRSGRRLTNQLPAPGSVLTKRE